MPICLLTTLWVAQAVPAPGVLWPEVLAQPAQAAAVERYATQRIDATARRLAAIAGRPVATMRTALSRQIALNLIDKMAKTDGDGRFVLSDRQARRTVIDYETFKGTTFVRSGVFAKRYFGYFDERGDTRRLEVQMRQAIMPSVAEANRVLAERASPIRITEMEVAVTFIAEGGALLLANDRVPLNAIHPVLDVGLDDIASGLARDPVLVTALDRRLSTGLDALVERKGGQTLLARKMKFVEAIAATVLMWVYEKQLAAEHLRKKEKKRLEQLDVHDQFIFSSLVYNSGLIFSSRRVAMIRDFSTGVYLHRVSENNAVKRWRLPVRR